MFHVDIYPYSSEVKVLADSGGSLRAHTLNSVRQSAISKSTCRQSGRLTRMRWREFGGSAGSALRNIAGIGYRYPFFSGASKIGNAKRAVKMYQVVMGWADDLRSSYRSTTTPTPL